MKPNRQWGFEMAEFSELQQSEIARLAQEAFKRSFEDPAQLKDAGGKLVAAGLPWLSRCEKLISNLWSVIGIVVAMPLAYFGLEALADQRIQKGLDTQVTQKLDDEQGPLKSRLRQFSAFKGNLTDQFANNVDSATSKLLRFGCNAPGGAGEAGDGFVSCSPGVQGTGATSARAVQEMQDQMLLFKADPAKQRVLLRLSLLRVDDLESLLPVVLRLESPPLLSAGTASKRIELKTTDLPDTHEFVTASGQLRLYGPVANRGDQEPLAVDVDLTRHLRTKSDLHALRFRTEALAGPDGARVRGNERFYLQAIVVVTHSLPKD